MPRERRFFGVTGPAGAGKDTIGQWLATNHNVRVAAFATPIRKMIYALMDQVKVKRAVQGYYVNDHEGKETPIPELGGVTARHLMQTLGTEWGRNAVNEDFWTQVAATRFNNLLSGRTARRIGLVFTDVRFPNEVDLIHAVGGTIIRVTRPGITQPARTAAHASETAQLDADVHIVNDGTPEELFAQLAEHFPPPPPLPIGRPPKKSQPDA